MGISEERKEERRRKKEGRETNSKSGEEMALVDGKQRSLRKFSSAFGASGTSACQHVPMNHDSA